MFLADHLTESDGHVKCHQVAALVDVDVDVDCFLCLCLLDAVATKERTALVVVSTANNRKGCDEEGSDGGRGCDHGLEVVIADDVELVVLGLESDEEGYVFGSMM